MSESIYLHKFTPDEVELARRLWSTPRKDLPPDDAERGRRLGLYNGGFATNLCNDVCHGYRRAD